MKIWVIAAALPLIAAAPPDHQTCNGDQLEHIRLPRQTDGVADTNFRRLVRRAQEKLNEAARSRCTIDEREVGQLRQFAQIFDTEREDDSWNQDRLQVLKDLVSGDYEGVELNGRARQALCAQITTWDRTYRCDRDDNDDVGSCDDIERMVVPVNVPEDVQGVTRDPERVRDSERYLNAAAKSDCQIRDDEVQHIRRYYRDVFHAADNENFENPRIVVLEGILHGKYDGVRLSTRAEALLCELIGEWTDDPGNCD
jgi:hypothetical protein